MRGTVKWFNYKKGYGFITGEDGKEVFVHYSSIQMDGRKILQTDDLVEYEIGKGTTDREQAVNVVPLLTFSQVEKNLNESGFQIKISQNQNGKSLYIITSADNVIQTSEHGMSFAELVAYAGLHYPM